MGRRVAIVALIQRAAAVLARLRPVIGAIAECHGDRLEPAY